MSRWLAHIQHVGFGVTGTHGAFVAARSLLQPAKVLYLALSY
jgi:hypothetical protein